MGRKGCIIKLYKHNFSTMADFPWDLSGEMWKHGDIASNIWDLE
jgi:hypothetical protein